MIEKWNVRNLYSRKKPSPGWGRCREATDEGEIGERNTKKIPLQ